NFYTISSQASEGGRIIVDSTHMAQNSSTSFTVAPDSGYQISDVWVNGVSVGPVSTYKLENITSNIVVKALFEKKPTPWSNSFADVAETDWFYEAVAYTSQNGLFHGTGPDLFSPGQDMTRAMFVTVLANMGHADTSQTAGFVDIAPGAWYAGSIAWASQKGIVSGVGQNRFAPDQVITRQEMITILYNYAKLAGLDVSNAEGTVISEYSDSSNLSDWAITAMRWAIHEGVISGKHGNMLDPQGIATRAEAAMVLQRLSIRYGMTVIH
ncbi:MAG TPA: S-layer homology domain-containing protein, partial [Syntrophomonadaceae bacterium]|nr:S-layer homology domain-containing protein [Syntrophomonadaceae bacterium]